MTVFTLHSLNPPHDTIHINSIIGHCEYLALVNK